MKKKKIIFIIGGVIILIGACFGGYKYTKYSSSNKSLNESKVLMLKGDYNGAKQEIDKAKTEYPGNKKIALCEDELNANIEAQGIYNEGLELEKAGNLNKAITVLEKINPNAKQVKEKANKSIEEIKNKLINKSVEQANNYIGKGDFSKADAEISNIEKIDSKNSNIETLKKKESEKKAELVNSYIQNANKAINNMNLGQARENINNLKSLDSNNENISKLNTSLNKALTNEKFASNKYVGLGNEVKTRQYMSPYIGQVTLMSSYYNPDIISNQSFISYYNANIKPYLRPGVIYDLINIKKPGTGLIFSGAPNENDEFNKGEIESDGGVNINDPNTQYCGIHGQNIISFMLSNHKQVPFTFK